MQIISSIIFSLIALQTIFAANVTTTDPSLMTTDVPVMTTDSSVMATTSVMTTDVPVTSVMATTSVMTTDVPTNSSSSAMPTMTTDVPSLMATSTSTFDSNNYDCFTTIYNVDVTVTLVENEQTITTVTPTLTTSYYSAPKPTVTSLGDGDLAILNYALTLEYLEREFYRQGVSNYSSGDFKSQDNYAELKRVASHEQIHVETLIKVINATYPNKYVAPCKYSFGVSNVSEFLGVARALERTGVSAYLGRVAEISNKAYLTAAGTIVTVEARHASFLNTLTGYPAAPEPFDTPLPPNVIVSIASQFITSCPFDLGVTPLEKLTVTTYNSNTTVHVDQKYNGMYCYFVYGANKVWVAVNNMTCYRPNVNHTDMYLFITKTSSDSDYLAGPVVLSEKSVNGSGYTDGQKNTNDKSGNQKNSALTSSVSVSMVIVAMIAVLM
jgi:rubrerythrin